MPTFTEPSTDLAAEVVALRAELAELWEEYDSRFATLGTIVGTLIRRIGLAPEFLAMLGEHPPAWQRRTEARERSQTARPA